MAAVLGGPLPVPVLRSSSKGHLLISKHSAAKSTFGLLPSSKKSPCHQLGKTTNATDEITALTSADPDITWQIVIGSLAGVTPFVVAGIEFSKRIVKQRKCEVCGGSGLVLENKFYKRCPSCAIVLQTITALLTFFLLRAQPQLMCSQGAHHRHCLCLVEYS